MNDILAWDEIKAKYAGQWLLISCSQLDEDMNVVSGEVLAHSADRDEVYRTLLCSKQGGLSLAIEYAGAIPDDVAVML